MRTPKKDPDIEVRLNFSDRRQVISDRLNKWLRMPLRWRPLNDSYYGILSRAIEDAALLALRVDQDLDKAKRYFYFSELSMVRQYLEFSKGATAIMGGGTRFF